MTNTYSLYRHVFPTGETYIGITKENVRDRWDNGFGYENQRKFFKRIVAVGWNNILHEIIETSLDEKTAREKERKLIQQLSNENREKCLNTCFKGHSPLHKTDIGDVHFRENKDIPRRYAEFLLNFSDDWMENYHDIFNCYPHFTEIHDDFIILTWYLDLEKPTRYEIPLPEYVQTYYELWHYLMDYKHEPILRDEE